MTLTAVLSTATLAASPGQVAGCDVRVTNAGPEPVTVDLALAGPAAPWAVVVPSALSLAPGASARSRVVVEIPRANDLAGSDRELAVAVAARDCSELALELAGRVSVLEARELRASVTPLMARARGPATYTVIVANHGTGTRRLDLRIDRSVEAGVRIGLAPAQLVLAAGESGTAEVTVRPRKALLAGGARPHPVVVHAQPEGGPALTAAATHFQEPVRWRLGGAVVALVAAVAGVLALTPGDNRAVVPAVAGPATATVAASPCPEAVAGAPARIDIVNFGYCPAVLTVAAGADVAWSNADLSPHTATFDGPADPFDSELLAQGQTWSRRFDRAGTYPYYCRLHPGMTGTIVVT